MSIIFHANKLNGKVQQESPWHYEEFDINFNEMPISGVVEKRFMQKHR